ncbi:ATP/GTP-binding site motif A (P-loop) [Methanococcus vannielii SB]|uniref:ATP/GTP-binding site motif A (P-loop) n=1 Tax=Methanococcus vannielii (strain ATCC 35089 / DSM 1224 / JCM 13029 / OCM 148 / SB) TaxID=406327 RepID=A6UN65_METVS|nr:selenouridine synthase SelU-like subunit [Methanococcus vannielii]ABR53937.1 ATP/GTP-binding site motif A (P-loop) [Methanococcus vannielii SB]
MIIIGLFGKTGSGKTEILEELKKNYSVVDIECCANTRGSVLGDLYDLKQKTQSEFDNCLKKQHEFAKNKGYCIVEFEGRKIGGAEKIDIPEPYSSLEKYSYNILIECSYDSQIERLLRLYIPKNDFEKEIAINKFLDLKKAFSKPDKLKILDEIIFLVQNDRYLEASRMIEKELYSEHYLRHIRKVKHDLLVENNNILESAEIISKYVDKILKKHEINP